jgi:predicted nucleic acid-binding protein
MMTAVLVDSNVLLDLMTEDARWLSWSAAAVEQATDRFRLVINPIIYAEVSIRYSRIEDLEAALPKAMMRPHSSRGSVFWFIGNEGERSNHRFRTF